MAPSWDRDSGSMRMAAILRLWKELGASVTFTSMAGDCEPSRDSWLGDAGIDVLSGADLWAGPTQVLAAVGTQFDVILVSYLAPALYCKDLLRHFAPQALFVFDTVDLHFLRLQREALTIGDPRIAARAAITRQQELGIVRAADLTLVVSAVEQALLLREAPDARVEVLSNVHDAPGRRHGFEQRQDVFFVGGFAHAPNVDAVHWYAAEIWPRIRRRLPGLRTFLVGSDMPASVVALASNGIVAVGYAPDLRPWLAGCRVAIAPLRYGAGVKGKVNIALGAGVPVVATTIAAEGMHLEHGRDVLIGDTAEEFADAVVRLHEAPELWTGISDAGLIVARHHFSPDVARQVLERVRGLALSRQRHLPDGNDLPTGAAILPRRPVGRRRALILPPASYGSLGDEAMVRGLVSCIQSRDAGWTVDLLSIDGGAKWPTLPGIGSVIDLHPGETAGWSGFVARLAEVARGYDAFAVLGADVLDGHYSIESSLQRLALARTASQQGCATAILGFSVNDSPASEVAASLAATAERVPLYVRDPTSWRRLHGRAIRNLTLVADLAFLLRPCAASPVTDGTEKWIRSERSSGRRVVMLNLSAQWTAALRHGGNDRAGELIELACNLIAYHGASILWCPHDLRQAALAGESDCELAAAFSALVAQRRGGGHHQHVTPPMGADEAKRVAGRVDMVVASRMHLAIAALGMGRPVIGIAYQGKFEGLWEHFGLRGNLFDAQMLACSELHQSCIDALGHLEALSAQVATRLPTVVALARRQVDLWLTDPTANPVPAGSLQARRIAG